MTKDDKFSDLCELSAFCEPGLVSNALKQRGYSLTPSDIHKLIDLVMTSPERSNRPVRCAQTLSLFWVSFNKLPSVRSRFEDDAIQTVLESGYSTKPQPRFPTTKN